MPDFSWGSNRKPGSKESINQLFMAAVSEELTIIFIHWHGSLHPHLSVIDGFEGMEGRWSKLRGTPVDPQDLRIASTDWLAADRVGIELMGIDFARVGYLNFCAEAGLGCLPI